MLCNRFFLGCGFCAILAHTAVSASPPRVVYPPTEKKTVADTYQRVIVRDDYQWLEQSSSPEVKAWAEKQDTQARAFLDALPGRAQLAAQMKTLITSAPPSIAGFQLAGGKIFALKFDPAKQQQILVMVESPDQAVRSAKSVCDPNTLDPTGVTAIDWFVPSHDGSKVAVSLSKNGTEDGTLFFFDAATGQQLPGRIPHVQYPTGGGSAAWTRDGQGIFYTRYPSEDERPIADLHFYQQVFFHRFGTPVSEDTYAIGKEFPKIAEVELQSSATDDLVVATVANGDGGDYEHFARGPDNKWNQLTRFTDGVKKGKIGPNLSFFAVSLAGAPRGQIVKFASVSNPVPTKLVEQGRGVLEELDVANNFLLVKVLEGGPSVLQVYDLDGKNPRTAPVAPVSNIGELTSSADLALVRIGSYTSLPEWFRYDARANQLISTALNAKASVSFDDLEVTRDFATSRDGTKVPLNIVHKRGLKLNGQPPAILYGYGGYGLSEEPRVRLSLRAWYDRGGIYVDTNLRGGNEFGEEWHKAGNLTRKQNVFDDFAACAHFLVEHKYTSVPKLGMFGGSNGGLLMGVMITQHPALMKAAVSEAGIYDSLRSELEPNGLFNVTEFGSVKDPAQFKALFAYSPYHHVVDGTKYPAVLLTAGLNDGRVAPSNSLKFAARLQAAAAPGNPILLRINSFGHGFGSSLDQQVSDLTDVFAFFASQLGATLPGALPETRSAARH
jgi:prolyl oligopeptidase